MKKATKRIPVKFIITHPITGNIHYKTVFTNDVVKYLKQNNSSKWQMIPFKKYRVWFEDEMEEDGGYWWNCYADAHGYLRPDGYNLPVEELDTLQWYIEHGYKVEEL